VEIRRQRRRPPPGATHAYHPAQTPWPISVDLGPGFGARWDRATRPGRRIAAHRRMPANEVGDRVAREGMIIWIDSATVSG
jgi:hypothetical protein